MNKTIISGLIIKTQPFQCHREERRRFSRLSMRAPWRQSNLIKGGDCRASLATEDRLIAVLLARKIYFMRLLGFAGNGELPWPFRARHAIVKISSAFILVLLLLPALSGQELTGEDIVQKVNDLFNVESSYAKAKMTIVTTLGQKRTFIYESWSKNKGEKNLVRYLEPTRVKDQATLMLNNADDIWMYFPRTQRVRKLASHAKKQKMQGSDFSYEDMGSGDAFINDFSSKRLKDEKMEGYDCYKVELTRKPDSDVSYSRLIMWVIKDNFVPVVIDYYDEDDPTLQEKRLVESDILVIDNIPTAMKVVMYNKNNNAQTELELLEVKYNITLPDSMFSERGLKK
jgi:outer membrane lipoprotein-sorting protein